MTDDRDARAPESAETERTTASDLPEPAEDRSARADPGAGNGGEPRADDGSVPEFAPSTAPATEAGAVDAAGAERAGEPRDEEARGGAPEAGEATAAGGGTAVEPRDEEGSPGVTASDEVRVVGGELAVELRAEEAGEQPRAEDAASVAEDAPGPSAGGRAGEASPAESSRPAVSAETPPVGEATEEGAEKETPAAAPPPREAESTAAEPPVADVSAETSAGAEADGSPEKEAAAAAPELQPSPESVAPPAPETAPVPQAAAPAEPAIEPAPEAPRTDGDEAAAERRPAAAASEEKPAVAEPAASRKPAAVEPAAAAEPETPDDPALAELKLAKEAGTTVEGKVIGWNRGGFHVVVGEVTAFCPSSEMELGRPRNPQSYVDRELTFRVVKFQKKGRRVVLSRAAVLGEERRRVVEELAPGAVVRGKVTSLPDFGAFVDLGGVEGLVHVSEISRGRVKSPKEALQVGQEVEVKVLKVEQDGERISLSMKDLEPDPWKSVADRYPRGERFPGKVARRADFGLFVELEPEVEGLVHVSQLPPGTEIGDPSLDPGTEIEVWVREVDRKRQRISLSLREIPSEDPWKDAAKRFPEGEMVDGTVESIAPFGVFVNLAPGLTGLLPGSQTGLPKGTSAARAFTPGQKVRVQILSIDSRRKRISLGREGSRVEATRGDLQEFKKQQREREQEAPTAMAAAFARLRDEREESGKS